MPSIDGPPTTEPPTTELPTTALQIASPQIVKLATTMPMTAVRHGLFQLIAE